MTSTDPSASTSHAATAGTIAPRPIDAPRDVAVAASESAQAGLTSAPKRANGALVLGIIGVLILAVLALFVAVYLVSSLGSDAAVLGGILALVPLTIVLLGARWIDRWEPEPRLAVVFAFLWGAVAAVIIALLVGAGLDSALLTLAQGDQTTYEFIGSVVQAPLVEESAKGLGILTIFLVARRYFDGPVDGVVYAAWVAGGFAFTENILYFGDQLLNSGGDGDVFSTFLIRGIMSPFAHVMFTACTGVAIGIGARRGGLFGGLIGFVIGLVPAMLLHGLWNGALFVVSDFFGYYAIIQFPLFVMAVVLVLVLRRQESQLTHDRLAEYAQAGWFAPDEVSALATGAGRRQAMAWASRNGKRKQMKRYIEDATRLAFARQRIITGRGGARVHADETARLEAVLHSRAKLVSAG